MDLTEARKRFQALRETLLEQVKQSLEITAMDAIQMINERILSKGQDFNNTPMKPYSEQYKKRKEKSGKYVGYVNLKWSGHMLGSIGIVEEKITPTEARVVVKGRDDFSQLLLEVNSGQRGDVLGLSKEELKILREDFNKRTEKRILELLEK